MIITAEYLRQKNACAEHVEFFVATFGQEVDITPTLCASVADKFDWGWAARHLLSAPLLAEYDKAVAPLRAEYLKAVAPLWAEYNKAVAPLRAEAEYEKDVAQRWAEYLKAVAHRWAECWNNQEAK